MRIDGSVDHNGIRYKQVRVKKSTDHACALCVARRDLPLCETLSPYCRFDSVFMPKEK